MSDELATLVSKPASSVWPSPSTASIDIMAIILSSISVRFDVGGVDEPLMPFCFRIKEAFCFVPFLYVQKHNLKIF